MTQLPQDEFEACLEKAEAWITDIHRRLKENDNTQGPRGALEARLRETEKIYLLEPDGKLLLDSVLRKAEALLEESDEDLKHEIHVKLGDIKAKFEETITYMTHCHSRIEWVWLHWNEYLRARDDFSAWVHNMRLLLEPDIELQLGLKEKGWQYEQALVLQRDVKNQFKLLERLLEEASSLYNRIGDPSVDESVQSAMADEYKAIKKKTEERLKCLEKIWKEHEAYDRDVNLFKSWLNGVIEKLKCCVASASESTESRLSMLQEIGKDVEIGKKQVEVLEVKSAEVIRDTSPLGAEKICKELEELRRTLKELKMMNDEEEEGLLKTYNSENAFLQLAEQLEGNINEFRRAIQRLEESLESGVKVKTEEELIALWKTLNVTKSALAGEEAKAERVKVQLRDLFKFSKDIQPLSDAVIAAMREYQRAKSKAFKLSTDTESELRQLFQNPLREFLYWKPIAESVLDTTAVAANNGTVSPDSLERIEKLLEESGVIKERLAALEEKKERVQGVFGEDKTKLLLRDVRGADKERAALHCHLLERRSRLQALASVMEEFEVTFRMLQQRLSALRVTCTKEDELQPDIMGKEGQLQRLQILLDDLTKLYSPIKDLAKMDASPSHAHRASKLLSNYLALQRTLENNIRNTKEHINNHWMFNNALLDLQRWLMEARQEIESYQDGSRGWSQREAEALLAGFSEKDVQRHQVEAQGQLVMDTSSPEGAALIHTDIQQLIDSWDSLRDLCQRVFRSRKERAAERRSPVTITIDQTSGFQSGGNAHSPPQRGRTPKNRSTGGYGLSLSSSGLLDHPDYGSIPDQQSLDVDPGNASWHHRSVDPGNGSFHHDQSPEEDRNNTSYNKQSLDDYHNNTSYNKQSPEEDRNSGSYNKQSLDDYHINTSYNKQSPEEDRNSSSYNEQSLDDDRNNTSYNKQSLEEDRNNTSYNKQSAEEDRNNTSYNKQSLEEDHKSSFYNKQSLEEDRNNTSYNKQSLEEDRNNTSYNKLSLDEDRKSSSYNKQSLEEDRNSGSYNKQSLEEDRNNTSYNKQSLEEDRNSGSYNKQSLEEDRNNTSYNKQSLEEDVDKGSYKSQPLKLGPGNSLWFNKDLVKKDGNGGSAYNQPSLDWGLRSHVSSPAAATNSTRSKEGKISAQPTPRFIAENRLREEGRNPPQNTATPRTNRKMVSLAESVGAASSPAARGIGGNKAAEDHMTLLMEFERWLCGENAKLSRICAQEIADADAVGMRRSKLEELQSRVPRGQKLFEALLLRRPAMAVTEDLRLEDLRYRWMLYKSKLRESGRRRNLQLIQEPRDVTKKWGGLRSFLQRVCCAALPLQLLLLLLLLLAFLLPLLFHSQNCALANNFARSFTLMLKYDGPPPT